MRHKIVVVLLLPLFAFKCLSKKTRESFIVANNQLSQNVYCVPSFMYPDTSLSFTSKEKILANDSIYYLGAGAIKKVFYMPLCQKDSWDKIVKSGVLQIFVFDERVVKESNWNDITANRRYLRRITYKYSDIYKDSCRIIVK